MPATAPTKPTTKAPEVPPAVVFEPAVLRAAAQCLRVAAMEYGGYDVTTVLGFRSLADHLEAIALEAQ